MPQAGASRGQFHRGQRRWWPIHQHKLKYQPARVDLTGWTVKNPILTSQNPSDANIGWSSSSRHVGLVLVRKGTSSTGIPPKCSFLSEIRGVVPCTPVPQPRLVGIHSLNPSYISVTPSPRLPLAKYGRSSFSRPTQTSHCSRCRVSARSLNPKP